MSNSSKQRVKWWLSWTEIGRENGEMLVKGYKFCYKMNMFSECNAQHSDYN